MSRYEEIVEALGKGYKVTSKTGDKVLNVYEKHRGYLIVFKEMEVNNGVLFDVYSVTVDAHYLSDDIAITKPPEEFWLRRYGEDNFSPQKFKTKAECMEFTDRDIECVLFREVRDGSSKES